MTAANIVVVLAVFVALGFAHHRYAVRLCHAAFVASGSPSVRTLWRAVDSGRSRLLPEEHLS